MDPPYHATVSLPQFAFLFHQDFALCYFDFELGLGMGQSGR